VCVICMFLLNVIKNKISSEVNFAALILAQYVSKLISFMPLRPILFFFHIFRIIFDTSFLPMIFVL